MQSAVLLFVGDLRHVVGSQTGPKQQRSKRFCILDSA